MTTGTAKRYYYVKSKPARSPAGRPVQLLVPKRPAATALDMDFAVSAPSRVALNPALTALRLTLIAGLVVAMYLGGGVLSQAAAGIKADLTMLTASGVDKLELAAVAITQRDIATARDNFVAAQNLFSTAQKQILSLGQTNLYMSGLGDTRSTVITGQKLVDSGLNLAVAGQLLVDTMTPLWQYFSGLSDQPASPADLATQVVGLMGSNAKQLDQAIASVTKANILLASVDPRLAGSEYAEIVVRAQIKTAALQRAVTTLGTLARELPAALGFNNPRQYLILNQNNNELRATGGFVGSYMLVEVYKGKLQSVLVDMTQRIDGQNPKTTLTLPEPLSTITTSFGTRDANWYLDFPTSAQTFQKLYEQVGGGTADGIIAINPEVIRDLLGVLGPVYLPDKDLTLTADNFVTATQEQIEVMDKHQTNPKEILNQFAPILLTRLLAATGTEIQRISVALTQRLTAKDILLYARSPKLQSVFMGLNLAGIVPTDTGGDMLAVVRSNLGGRKSSQTVAEEIHHTANINLAGDVTDTLQLNYTHTGTDVFPDGPNKDYVRVFLPSGSVRISAHGQDYGTTVESFTENDKTVLAFWLTTAPGETKTVELSYRLPTKMTDRYHLGVVKQPGAHNTALTSMLKLSPALDVAGEPGVKTKTLFTGKLQADLQLGVEIISVN